MYIEEARFHEIKQVSILKGVRGLMMCDMFILLGILQNSVSKQPLSWPWLMLFTECCLMGGGRPLPVSWALPCGNVPSLAGETLPHV